MRGDLAGGHVHHAVAGLDVRRGDEVELDAGSGYGLARLGVHLHRLYRALLGHVGVLDHKRIIPVRRG